MGGVIYCACDTKDYRTKGEFDFQSNNNLIPEDASQNDHALISKLGTTINHSEHIIEELQLTQLKLEAFKNYIKNSPSIEIIDPHQLNSYLTELVIKTDAKLNNMSKMKRRGSQNNSSIIELPPILFKKTGQVYQGQWNQDGKKQGYGVLITENGSKYDGYWMDNQFNGLGRLIYNNGDFCEGNFIKGMLEGKGVLVRVNGEKYKGSFVQNNKIGGSSIILELF